MILVGPAERRPMKGAAAREDAGKSETDSRARFAVAGRVQEHEQSGWDSQQAKKPISVLELDL